MTLVRPISAIAWDLRTAWATGRRVAVHQPSRLGDSDFKGGHWRGIARRVDLPGQLELPGMSP